MLLAVDVLVGVLQALEPEKKEFTNNKIVVFQVLKVEYHKRPF